MKNQKEAFSLREGDHYLNCAYKSPLLKSAEAAAVQALARERNPADIVAHDFFDEADEIRALFTQLIHAEAGQIALMPSVSYGMETILSNTPSKTNGNAVTLQDEFPSGYFALNKWCKQHANELIIAKPSGASRGSWNANVLDAITEQTSLVLMSSVHWMNGYRFDLEAIGKKCKSVGARFIVDGTQSVGALPMDIQQYSIDALVCASYKWLLGPYSTALTYLSNAYEDGEPLEEAWMNRSNGRNFQDLAAYDPNYRPQAGRYNMGEAGNLVLMPMLRTALQQIVTWGPEHIQAYCATLIDPLATYLEGLGVPLKRDAFFCSHLLALQLPDGVDRLKLQEN